jgi:hypothetical protein
MTPTDDPPDGGDDPMDGADPRGFSVSAGSTRTGAVVGVTAALVAFAAVGPYSWLTAATAGVGALALLAARFRGSEVFRRGGATSLALAPLLAGVAGAPPLAVGVGAWSALVAWDATAYGAGVLGQVGAASGTDPGVERRRARSSALVGAGALVLGGGAFLVGVRAPLAVGAFAVVAGVALVVALAID